MRVIKIIATMLSMILFFIFLMPGCSNQNNNSTPGLTSSPPATSTSAASGSRTTVTTPSSQPGKATANNTSGNLIKLKTISFIDQQGIGTEAFKLLIPTDWEYEGGVEWLLDNPTMPAISQFRVWNPNGTEQFEVLPNQAFFWTDNPLTSQLFPPGSKYFGNEVKQPLGPVEALKEIVIPRFRPEIQGLKIINEEDIADIVNQSGSQSQSALPTSTEAGKIRVEYTENGKALEEEIYCVVEATYIPLQTMYGTKTNIMWGVNYIGSFRAEKGKLDASAKIFQTVSDSVTLNLKWFNKYVQVVEYLIQMQIQQIESVGQLGSIIAQTGDEIRQENLDLYYQREEMNDRVSTQFSETIRDVDSYFNPLEDKNVEVPTGYDNVWVNGNGEYVLSDNPNYNPNIGNNQNFQRLEKAKP
jgi:hypothetical protein